MRRFLVTALLGFVLLSCTGQQPTVNAAQTLKDGAAAMAQLKTVSATVKLTKGTVSLQGFTLVSARTSVQLPADSDTVYTVKQKDVTFGIHVVISAGHVYLQLPFLKFQEVTGPQAAEFPDMAKLFDQTTGLPAIIPAGTNPQYVTTEQVDGRSSYQITTGYTAEQIHGLLTALNSSGPVSARIWVDTSNHLIRKAVLSGAFGDGGKEADVEVDMTGFNAPITISSPTP
jgi:outer membrane lipoprotein-sorting protein